MADLYDRVQKNPEELEPLENTLQRCINRGRRFSLSSARLAVVPDRKKLRRVMQKKYGIENIDSYFIPVLVDLNTYRRRYGVNDISIADIFGKSPLTPSEGVVNRYGAWCIAYLLAEKEVPENIEHEAIHAAMFKHNPDYADMRKTLHLSRGDALRAWSEAVAYIATSQPDKEKIFEKYIPGATTRGKGALKKHLKYLTGSWICEQAQFLPERNITDALYSTMWLATRMVNLRVPLTFNREESVERWKHAFATAERIKQERGVKGLVAMAQTEPVEAVLGEAYAIR